MKKISLIIAVLGISSVVFAKEEIQCSDPKVLEQFDTWEQADVVCSAYKNTYVSYDHVYKKYVCGCTAPDNGSGE